mmetsp:Transcript_19266/g.46535  ORF Transcript_19266/g.46535 Transcript_19266/m.46535 type:complete len:201 (-) Transcript_19266:77-679(-)
MAGDEHNGGAERRAAPRVGDPRCVRLRRGRAGHGGDGARGGQQRHAGAAGAGIGAGRGPSRRRCPRGPLQLGGGRGRKPGTAARRPHMGEAGNDDGERQVLSLPIRLLDTRLAPPRRPARLRQRREPLCLTARLQGHSGAVPPCFRERQGGRARPTPRAGGEVCGVESVHGVRSRRRRGQFGHAQRRAPQVHHQRVQEAG